MNEFVGQEAKRKAVEWGYQYDDIDTVTKATESNSRKCRVVTAGGTSFCTTCSNVWYDYEEDDE